MEDFDQPARPRSLIRVFDGRSMCSKWSIFIQPEKIDPDQTVWMLRLI